MKGYAYLDESLFPHVVESKETAKKYSVDGKIYEYEGKYAHGYALDSEGRRAVVPIVGYKDFGNAPEEGSPIADGTFKLIEE